MASKYAAILIVLFFCMILLAGCSDSTQAPAVTPTPQIIYVTVPVTPSSTQSQNAPLSTTTISEVTTFHGNGDDVQSFTASGDGIRIFDMSYSGSSNFAIWLEDNQGNHIDLLVNKIGSYEGKKSEHLGPGTYYLDVTASGAWTVDLTSP